MNIISPNATGTYPVGACTCVASWHGIIPPPPCPVHSVQQWTPPAVWGWPSTTTTTWSPATAYEPTTRLARLLVWCARHIDADHARRAQAHADKEGPDEAP